MESLKNDINDFRNQRGTEAQRTSFKGPNIGLYVNGQKECIVCKHDLSHLSEEEQRQHGSVQVRRDGLMEE